MACATRDQAVRVVLIDTQYVETDAMSFKSVVQSLTGKDSCVSWIEKSSFGVENRKSPVAVNRSGFDKSGSDYINNGCGGTGNRSVSMLSKGMSFKDLDVMILQAPPMEDLQWLWADNK
ncbi:VQ motif-containing protein 1-like [Juglans microcarpa x Juglans regia]|uniref:VQ motif-containing protein 1-like n=1 Tax=Juglans microcarpa x Juglans regia TaxID=2249226 RepID=UPI001B7E0C22|nr:VQ motif-containing protein 1-like [Juglans microcarpa x Juglans regia]